MGFFQRLAGRIRAAQRRKIVTVLDAGNCKDAPVKRCHAVEHGDLVARDRREDALGAGAVLDDRAGNSVAQRKQNVVPERADEAPFAGREHHVGGLRRHPGAVAVAERREPTVSVHDPFWLSRGAGGEHDERDVVRLGIEGPRIVCSLPRHGGARRQAQPASGDDRARGTRRKLRRRFVIGRRRCVEDRLRLGQFDDVFDFAPPELGILENRHRARPHGPKESRGKFHRVRHPQQHLIAGPNAQGRKVAGNREYCALECVARDRTARREECCRAVVCFVTDWIERLFGEIYFHCPCRVRKAKRAHLWRQTVRTLRFAHPTSDRRQRN